MYRNTPIERQKLRWEDKRDGSIDPNGAAAEE
jgi:hypothetical protein